MRPRLGTVSCLVPRSAVVTGYQMWTEGGLQ
jgi:hypothetical protein